MLLSASPVDSESDVNIPLGLDFVRVSEITKSDCSLVAIGVMVVLKLYPTNC